MWTVVWLLAAHPHTHPWAETLHFGPYPVCTTWIVVHTNPQAVPSQGVTESLTAVCGGAAYTHRRTQRHWHHAGPWPLDSKKLRYKEHPFTEQTSLKSSQKVVNRASPYRLLTEVRAACRGRSAHPAP